MAGRQRESYTPGLGPAIVHVGWARPRSAMESGLGAHQHQQAWELCWLVHGQVEWWAETEALTVLPGQCYITRPGEWHGAVHSALEPCELFWLGLRAGVLPAIDAALAAAPRVFTGVSALSDMWWEVLRQHRTPALPLAELATEGALLRLLVEVVRCAAQSPAMPPISPAIRRAQEFARQHVTNDPAVAALARTAGLSASQFHARFEAEVGEPPAEWIRRLRLNQARRLLADPKRPITSIAMDLGYPTSQYFATVFRRYVGITPRQYRERCRGAPT